MKCPKCGNIDDKVIDSRQSKDGLSIRRRRECLECGYRFTTYEEVERMEMRVIKRDGRIENFQREKLYLGIAKAFEKRPVEEEILQGIVDDVVQKLNHSTDRDVPSKMIGAVVMEHLHAVDEVAFIRYASVHRQYQDVEQFVDEVQQLERRVKPHELQAELFAPSSDGPRPRRNLRN